MGRRTCIARSTRCPTCARRRASRRGRCAASFRCCAEWRRTASRTTSPSSSTRRARPSATTGTPTTRRTGRRCPTISCAQIEPLHELVRAHGWPLLMVDGVEADDVIGTLAIEAAARGIDCVVSTSDKDLAQLVRPGVTLVNTMSNETLDDAGVVAKFGVRADQVLDLLTLTGDAVDNVPGVAKVGPKTAVKWLTQYGSLDAIVAHADEIPGVVGENLRAALDWLPQGRRLLTVKTDCALPVGAGRSRARAAGRRGAEGALPALRVQVMAARPAGRGRTLPAPAAPWPASTPAPRSPTRRRAPTRAASRCATRRPPTRRRRFRVTTRPCSTRRRSRAGADAIAARGPGRLRHRDDQPRPAGGADRRPVVRGGAGARLLHPARPPLSRRARPARARRRARATSRRGSRIPRGGSSARTSSTTSTCSPTTAWRSPASRTTRCCSPTCSRRTSRTTWTASRGATST